MTNIRYQQQYSPLLFSSYLALDTCSVYGNKDVGEKFNAMLEMGSSKPWPDALEAFTGTRDMDGSAIIEYFAPVMTYLQAENSERSCGW